MSHVFYYVNYVHSDTLLFCRVFCLRRDATSVTFWNDYKTKFRSDLLSTIILWRKKVCHFIHCSWQIFKWKAKRNNTFFPWCFCCLFFKIYSRKRFSFSTINRNLFQKGIPRVKANKINWKRSKHIGMKKWIVKVWDNLFKKIHFYILKNHKKKKKELEMKYKDYF